MGIALGMFVGSVLRVRRAHVEWAMTEGGIERPRHAARAMYRSLGQSVFEFLWLAGSDAGDTTWMDQAVRIDDRSLSLLHEARSLGRGIVLSATHTGNWDLAACAVARRIPLLVVTKRLSVRWLDRLWQATRAAYGVQLCEADAAVERARDALREGGAVAMMIDQVPLRRRHGIEVEFFGRTAWVDKAPAALAMRAGAPLLLAAAFRDGDGVHQLRVLERWFPPEKPDSSWIVETTRRATASLEQFVRARPSEWLWLHRRWRQPTA